MAAPINMTDTQYIDYGPTILDKDHKPLTELPAGASVTVVSSNEAVAGIEMHSDGMGFRVTSGQPGTATINYDAVGFGPTLTQTHDTIAVTVTNSVPGSLNLTPGVATEEDETPPVP
jgi:hypothetical protein